MIENSTRKQFQNLADSKKLGRAKFKKRFTEHWYIHVLMPFKTSRIELKHCQILSIQTAATIFIS